MELGEKVKTNPNRCDDHPWNDRILGMRQLDCYGPAIYELNGMKDGLKPSHWTCSMVEGHLETSNGNKTERVFNHVSKSSVYTAHKSRSGA